GAASMDCASSPHIGTGSARATDGAASTTVRKISRSRASRRTRRPWRILEIPRLRLQSLMKFWTGRISAEGGGTTGKPLKGWVIPGDPPAGDHFAKSSGRSLYLPTLSYIGTMAPCRPPPQVLAPPLRRLPLPPRLP